MAEKMDIRSYEEATLPKKVNKSAKNKKVWRLKVLKLKKGEKVWRLKEP